MKIHYSAYRMSMLGMKTFCMFVIIQEFEYDLFIQALLSLVYLCSSDIFRLITYVGFATWVRFFDEKRLT